MRIKIPPTLEINKEFSSWKNNNILFFIHTLFSYWYKISFKLSNC
nr:MAG TPA: hypothetical protein [Caudoviricetes sp.]